MATDTGDQNIQMVRSDYRGARIVVHLLPDNRLLSLPRAKTVRQLLYALNLEEEEALVARAGELLTPDRQIWPEDALMVRKVASSG